MKVKLICHTPDPERLVAAAARVCYSADGFDEEMDKLTSLISTEIDGVEKLIRLCNGVCTEALRNRAPESVEVNEGTTLLASLMFIFSMIATLCEDEGLTYPEDKCPGIIAIR